MKKVTTILMTLTIVNITANFRPIAFSQDEIKQHKRDAPQIAKTSATCLQEQLQIHQAFHNQWGISAFYGDQSTYAKLAYINNKNGAQVPYSEEVRKKEDYIKRNYSRYSSQEVSFLVKTLRPTSCIGLAVQCLAQGFKSAGKSVLWNKIRTYNRSYESTGMSLQHALQKLGWKVLYWNPNTYMNMEFDEGDRKRSPNNNRNVWGKHEKFYNNVMNRGFYYWNKVDDTSLMVDFGINPSERFKRIPFFLGIANIGYHVFPGFYGRVIEGHSTRALHDPKSVEVSEFNPLAIGGGPRGSYFSGLMAVPPGYLDGRETNNTNNRNGGFFSNFFNNNN